MLFGRTVSSLTISPTVANLLVDSAPPTAVTRGATMVRQQQSQQSQQQQILQRHTSMTSGPSTATNPLQRHQLPGLPPQPPPPPPPPPQRQLSTDSDIGMPAASQTTVGYCGVV